LPNFKRFPEKHIPIFIKRAQLSCALFIKIGQKTGIFFFNTFAIFPETLDFAYALRTQNQGFQEKWRACCFLRNLLSFYSFILMSHFVALCSKANMDFPYEGVTTLMSVNSLARCEDDYVV